MKIQYRETSLTKANRDKLNTINGIIAEYQRDNLVLTLRQLYYQLVVRMVIPNNQKEYRKISYLLTEGRMAGIVDWNAIEDRTREVEKPASWESPKSILRSAHASYERNRQEGQNIYMEVWVEKDALSGVLERVTKPYHVPIMVNRGYSSVSAMHDAYERFKEEAEDNDDKEINILYLGDHDPSGLDMVRDIKGRIEEFMAGQELTFPFVIVPIALTKHQIDRYKPPPNPAKMTDSRAEEYVKTHGKVSWEVDALPPNVLNDLVDQAITVRMDMDVYDEVMKIEKEEKQKLLKLIDKWDTLKF